MCAAHNYNFYKKDWSLAKVVVKNAIKNLLWFAMVYDSYQTFCVFSIPSPKVGDFAELKKKDTFLTNEED